MSSKKHCRFCGKPTCKNRRIYIGDRFHNGISPYAYYCKDHAKEVGAMVSNMHIDKRANHQTGADFQIGI